MNEFILILALLTTESSYASEIERPSTVAADTTQFWFGSTGTWRVRTYAVDHDIHVYEVGSYPDGSQLRPEDAKAHISKHYGDILAKIVELRFKDPNDTVEVQRVLSAQGLNGKLEIAPSGFAFYNADRGTYKTKSVPE
jgi:hypothetical protein